MAEVATLPITVVIAVRNEANNLPRCLDGLRDIAEVYVVDSGSTDDTVAIAQRYGAKVVQFHYQGGWPKKRQWALDTLPLAFEWVLLLDADEVLTPALAREIQQAIQDSNYNGYYIALDMVFLGRPLRHCGASFWKLALFRRHKGRYECRLAAQDNSMGDMEVHEHVVVDGPTAKLAHRVLHHNFDSLSRYIKKHDEYSNWEAAVWLRNDTTASELPPAFWGNQAQRRRWLKSHLLFLPGSSVLYFIYKYFLRGGFLDGVPGLIYCGFQAVQFFHIKAKIYEARIRKV
jgi:glycosyltransferase involved in cell wall biosynthesis